MSGEVIDNEPDKFVWLPFLATKVNLLFSIVGNFYKVAYFFPLCPSAL